MFSNLGLLSAERCPDRTCRRPRCFFSHGESSSSKPAEHTLTPLKTAIASPAKRKATSSENVRNAGRPNESDPMPMPMPMPKRTAVADGKNGNAPTAGNAQKAIQVSSTTTVLTYDDSLLRRKCQPHSPSDKVNRPCYRYRTSRHHNHEQTDKKAVSVIELEPHYRKLMYATVQTLYTQFAKLYTAVLPQSPDLAHQSALTQEAEISASSTALRSYKTAIHHAAVSISRRPPPDTMPHPSIGTVRESRVAHEAAEKEKAGRLSRAAIAHYCLPLDDYSTWRYPDPRDESLVGPQTGQEPSAESTTQTCNRCKVPFVVSADKLDERFGECRYHYGKTAPERVEGRRKWIYSCCGKERGEQGCEEGIHIFSDNEDDKKLASRIGFKTVTQCVEESQVFGDGVEVVGMDCEMICEPNKRGESSQQLRVRGADTTAGTSLGRVTIVDEKGETLLDELVRQKVPILDVNTRFSGITIGQLDSAIMDLPAVRAAACMFIGKETIIVGHGLENDLRALRLLHDKVVDTAVVCLLVPLTSDRARPRELRRFKVFPHDKGPPYRRALRDIVKEKLGYFIQDRTSDLGHSSAVDAKATLDALRWKVRDDKV